MAVAVLQAVAAQHPGHSLSRTTPAGCNPAGCCSPKQARSPGTSRVQAAAASPSMPSPRRGLPAQMPQLSLAAAAATAAPPVAAPSMAGAAVPQLVLQRLQLSGPANSTNISQASLSQRAAAIPTPRVGLQISHSVL